MVAAKEDNKDIVKFLIEKGANIDIQNNRGSTALMCARNSKYSENQDEIINLLKGAVNE